MECHGCHHYQSLSSEFLDGVSWLPWLPVIDGVSIVSGFFDGVSSLPIASGFFVEVSSLPSPSEYQAGFFDGVLSLPPLSVYSKRVF
jgi:hypothetical protein